jgi:chemotaxis protein CheX
MDSDIEEIAMMIWETLFELPLETSDAPDLTGASTVTSFVHIDGAWRGVVMLQCPMALATGLTSAMFDGGTAGSADEVDEADVRDALGEIANMIAGNVKALLPEPCTISLPAVALGNDHTVSVPGTAVVSTVPFTCDGHPFVITLLERPDGAKAAG